MCGKEGTFPFSVATHSEISAGCCWLSVWMLLLGLYVTRKVGGQGQNAEHSTFHYKYQQCLTVFKQLQFSIPVTCPQNRYEECLLKLLGFNIYKDADMHSWQSLGFWITFFASLPYNNIKKLREGSLSFHSIEEYLLSISATIGNFSICIAF